MSRCYMLQGAVKRAPRCQTVVRPKFFRLTELDDRTSTSSAMGGIFSSLFEAQHSPECIIEHLIHEHDVVIFSKSKCPYSDLAKDIFNTLRVPYKSIELDLRDDGPALQTTLGCMTDASTVPRVFVNGRCIGGGTETQRLYKNGQLQRLLRECMPGICCPRHQHHYYQQQLYQYGDG